MSKNQQNQTKKQEREQKGQRYSTIDLHLDETANGGYAIKQKAPFFHRLIQPAEAKPKQKDNRALAE